MALKHTISTLWADIAGPGVLGMCLGKAGAAVIPNRLPSQGQVAVCSMEFSEIPLEGVLVTVLP